VPAAGLVLTAIVSIQIGAALAVGLFSEVGAGGAVFLRAATAAAVLLVLWRPGLPREARSRWMILLFGVALAGVNLGFYEAIDRIPLGTAVTFEFTGPLAVALITSRRRRDWIWAGLAAIGILLLTGGVGGDQLDLVGVAFALGAGVCWAGYILIGTRLGAESVGGGPLALSLVVSAVLLAPSGIGAGGVDLLRPEVLALGLAVGMLSAAIPFSLELEAMRRLPANVFGVLMSLEPAVAAVVGLVLLGQGIGLAQAVAITFVVVASAGALYSGREPARVEP